MHTFHIVVRQPSGHRLDALALARQQQASAVVLKREIPIGMPCGFRQAFNICRKASFLWAWRAPFAHKTILH
jgi:hypothetical protein